MKLKVCGMRESTNISELLKLQPDYMGFIFYGKSKRDVADGLDVELLNAFPFSTKKVGVFVNASLDFVKGKVAQFGLDLVQLHGDETPEYCAVLKANGVKVMKVFSVGDSFDFGELEAYKPHVDFFLFDTKGKERGGNGELFNWEILNEYDGTIPYFLSGGIDIENIESLSDLKVQPYAIDINSKFEVEPGLKDVEKLKELKNLI
ncbi:phosphoribosylanthranilate isomerase [Roseivirga sp.]|uniref:phosphoribosylanthranilate isomerase n=1 Tax=Roseivirga sp. TaxID=1964215 RepID=UPI002B26781D|nr:phosphoribosylanthranilate isomerase [Roseivirga sp.]